MSDFNSETNRIKILDVIRGIALILMILDHSLYDIKSYGLFSSTLWIYKLIDFFNTPLYSVIWFIVVMCFFIIAGITSNFSKSNFRRAIYLIGFAFLLTLFTVLFVKGNEIYFGVLHCFGFCIFIYFLIEKFLHNVFKKIPIWIFLILFFVYYYITVLVSPIEPFVVSILNYKLVIPLFIIGFPANNFFSADFFPLLPWLFLFLFGAKLGKYIKEQRFPKWFYKFDFKPVSFVGRYPFLIYILHQPIILGLLILIDKYIK